MIVTQLGLWPEHQVVYIFASHGTRGAEPRWSVCWIDGNGVPHMEDPC